MSDVDRRSCLACLAAVEANMAELRGTESWYDEKLSRTNRMDWADMMAQLRVYQHDLSR